MSEHYVQKGVFFFLKKKTVESNKGSSSAERMRDNIKS